MPGLEVLCDLRDFDIREELFDLVHNRVFVIIAVVVYRDL